MKLRTWLLAIGAIAILCGGAAWYWLLHTGSGAVWILARVESLTDGAFTTQSLDGDFSSGVSVQGIGYRIDGLDVTTDIARVKINVDLLPVSVDIVSARIERVRVVIGESPDSRDESTDIEEVLRNLQLPIRVRVSDLVVEDVVLESPQFDYTVSSLQLAAEWHETLVVEHLLADGEGIHVEGDASFEPERNLAYKINVSVQLDPEVTAHPETLGIDLHSEGNPDRLDLRIGVANFGATAVGEIRHLLQQPAWDFEVSAKHYAWPLEDRAESVEIHDLSARSTGDLSAWSLSADADVHVPGTQPLSVHVEGDGNPTSFSAAMLRAEGPDLEASGTARVVWAADRVLETSLAVVRINPQFLMESWPDGYPLQGSINAVLDDTRLLISDTQLSIPRTGTELSLDADINRDSGSVLGALQWQNFRWPLDGDTPDIESEQADVRVSGTLDAWAVDGTIQLGARDMPEGMFHVDGGGDRDAAQVHIVQARLLGGTLEGELEYSWRGSKPWSGQVEMAAIQTGSLLPAWPGQVSGRVEASGALEPRSISARFTDVAGTLRGESLQANGGFSIGGGQVIVDDISAAHGASTFEAQGGLDQANGLAFEISIADIGDYVPDLSGNLKASGAMRTTPDQPFLSLVLDADELQYRDVILAGLRIEDTRVPGQVAALRLEAAGIQVGDREISEFTAQLTATTDQQSLLVSGGYLDSSMSMSLEGALEDWSDPLGAGWRGAITTFEISPDDHHFASLLAPAELYFSSTQIDIAEACVGPDADANFCATGEWSANGAYAAAAQFNEVPVDLVDFLVDTGLGFDQVVNGEVQWSSHPANGPSGFARLSTTPGHVTSIDGPQRSLATGAGLLSFEIADNTLLNGTLGLPLPGTGEINGTFRLHDLEHIEDSGISGGIVADISEIAVFSPLIPAIDRASGHLRADMNLTGSIGAPLFRGNLTIEDGSLAFDPLGLVLEDMSLVARMTENYLVDLSGGFRSGSGHGTVNALIDYRSIEEPIIRIGFDGERLALVNVEDLRVLANPSFDIALTSETLSVNGSLHIAEALVTPVNLSVSQVHESPDVVVVAGELPDLPELKQTEGRRYSGSLDVSLSDNVIVDLDVARASIEGKVLFEWRDDVMPFANGRYDIEGTITAFGQVLEISEGSVRFPNVPADNPIVRIRAEREIYGNTQVKRAGVLVDGPLKQPTIDPYTQPATTEERALTLLVTGSDFDYEQGVGAIDFGTYIAPRLFVSYGIGVFERDQIVSARYDLAKGFGIKASSGSKESGVDLNYRFEN